MAVTIVLTAAETRKVAKLVSIPTAVPIVIVLRGRFHYCVSLAAL